MKGAVLKRGVVGTSHDFAIALSIKSQAFNSVVGHLKKLLESPFRERERKKERKKKNLRLLVHVLGNEAGLDRFRPFRTGPVSHRPIRADRPP